MTVRKRVAKRKGWDFFQRCELAIGPCSLQKRVNFADDDERREAYFALRDEILAEEGEEHYGWASGKWDPDPAIRRLWWVHELEMAGLLEDRDWILPDTLPSVEIRHVLADLDAEIAASVTPVAPKSPVSARNNDKDTED